MAIIKEIKAYCKKNDLPELQDFLFLHKDAERVRNKFSNISRLRLFDYIYKIITSPIFFGKKEELTEAMREEVTRQCEDRNIPLPIFDIGDHSSKKLFPSKSLKNYVVYNPMRNTLYVSIEPFLSDYFVRGDKKRPLSVVKKLEMLNSIVPQYECQLYSKQIINGEYLDGPKLFVGSAVIMEQIELSSAARCGDGCRISEDTKQVYNSPSVLESRRRALVNTQTMLEVMGRLEGEDKVRFEELVKDFVQNNAQALESTCNSVKEFRYKCFHSGISNIFEPDNLYSVLSDAIDTTASSFFNMFGVLRNEKSLDEYADSFEKSKEVVLNDEGQPYVYNKDIDNSTILGLESIKKYITIDDGSISLLNDLIE